MTEPGSDGLPQLSLGAFLDQVPLPVASWGGPGHVFRRVSAAFCDLVERSAEQLLGLPARRALPEQSLEPLWRALDDLSAEAEAGARRELELALPRASEGRVWLRAELTLVTDGEGRVRELVGVARDVSAERRTEQESADRQRRLELALEAGKMGTWEWLISENRVVWSPAIERMHGLPVGSFAGNFEAYQADIHPEDRIHVLSQVQRVLAERSEHDITYRIIRPDGAVRWLAAHARLVLDAWGAPSRLVGVCQDVTEQKEAEEARARVMAAEAASREAERSRRLVVEILESIADPFIVMDQELCITFANEAAGKLWNTSREALLGKRPWEASVELDSSSFSQVYVDVLEHKQPRVVEARSHVSGRWLEASVFPLERGLSVYLRDVTERRRADELRDRLASQAALRADVSAALADSGEPKHILYRCCEALVRHLGVAFARVWTLDEVGDTLILQASAGLYTHTDGGHQRVPVGKFKIGRIAAERLPHLTNDVQHDPRISDPAWALREGMVAFAGYPLIVDNRLVGVMAMFSKAPIAEDTLLALAGVADTIAQGHERMLAERELEERVKELARSNAELEQFAYVASHDLQEPLRMIASYNQLLARRYKGKLDKDADEFIGYTVEGVTRMQRLINDLLAYSRVGTRGREFSPVDTGVALSIALSSLSRAIEDAGATVTHDPMPTLSADEGQLVQVFQNLVANALKFRREAAPRVHVGARAVDGAWVFSVADNGIGIDSQYFDRIFVIFQRLHPREKYPGTGIGLSICKKIVERHSGKIWVESNPGAGTTISFSIPADCTSNGRKPST